MPARKAAKRGRRPGASRARNGGGHGTKSKNGDASSDGMSGHGERTRARLEKDSGGTASQRRQAAPNETSGQRDGQRATCQPGNRAASLRPRLDDRHGRDGAGPSARGAEGGEGAHLLKRRGTMRALDDLGICASRTADMHGLARGEDCGDHLREQGRGREGARAAKINRG